MKRKDSVKRLQLNKHTIVSLSPNELEALKGGGAEDSSIICSISTSDPSICNPCTIEG